MMDINSIVGQQQAAENTAATNSAATLAKDFDNFLVLLTTQLQYQDPLAPMDSNQFTQQLVSFTGVEQSIQTNKNLEAIVEQNRLNEAGNAVSYLGKEILIVTNKAGMAEDGTVSWDYTLEASTNSTKITVKDENGFTVDEFKGELKAGTHVLNWQAPENTDTDVFTLHIEATSGNDETVNHTVYSRGIVDGIEKFNGEIMLASNGILTPPSNIMSVKEVKQQTIPEEDGTE